MYKRNSTLTTLEEIRKYDTEHHRHSRTTSLAMQFISIFYTGLPGIDY